MGAPRDELQVALSGIVEAGSPATGSGGFLLEARGLEGVMASLDERWRSSLPPDLPRAGPEIYRALRSEGSACTRASQSTRFRGDNSNKNAERVDLQNGASRVGFAVATHTHDLTLGFSLACMKHDQA